MIENKFQRLLKFFILLQPLLDCITSLTIRYTNINYSMGFIVRGIFAFISVVYILYYVFFNNNDKKYKKMILCYFIILILYFIFYVLFHYFNNVSLSQIITYFVKYFYFPVTIISIFLVFYESKVSIDNYSKLFFFNIIFYIFVMLISIFTGTSFYSYGIEMKGFSGWFYSANELSSIIAISLPISLLFLSDKKYYKNIIYLIFIVLVSIILLAIGTKTAKFSIILLQIFIVIISLFKDKKNFVFHVISLFVVIFIGFILGQRIINHFENYRSIPIINYEDKTCPIDNIISNTKSDVLESKIDSEKSVFTKTFLNKILSNRDVHLKQNIFYMKGKSLVDWMFGISFAKNSDNKLEITLIEMDAFDSIFRFGFIGFILIFLPFAYVFIQSLFKIIKIRKVNYKTLFCLFSTILGFIISNLVGHVISAPAVSIYLTFALVLLYYSIDDKDCLKEEIK